MNLFIEGLIFYGVIFLIALWLLLVDLNIIAGLLKYGFSRMKIVLYLNLFLLGLVILLFWYRSSTCMGMGCIDLNFISIVGVIFGVVMFGVQWGLAKMVMKLNEKYKIW